MLGDIEYVGVTTDGYPVYDIRGIKIVDTGCGTERYNEKIFG